MEGFSGLTESDSGVLASFLQQSKGLAHDLASLPAGQAREFSAVADDS
jgi:hypothetical protein